MFWSINTQLVYVVGYTFETPKRTNDGERGTHKAALVGCSERAPSSRRNEASEPPRLTFCPQECNPEPTQEPQKHWRQLSILCSALKLLKEIYHSSVLGRGRKPTHTLNGYWIGFTLQGIQLEVEVLGGYGGGVNWRVMVGDRIPCLIGSVLEFRNAILD